MISGLIGGVTSYGKAFNFLLKHRLFRYFVLPGLIGGLILIGLLWIVIQVLKNPLGNLLSRLVSWVPWEGIESFLANQMDLVAAILLGALAFILFKNLLIAVMSPFMSPLSERVEKIVRGHGAIEGSMSIGRILKETWRGLRISLRNIFKEILFTLLFLILGLIPVFSVISTILIFLVQSYYAGFGNLDYTLERRFSVRNSIEFVKDHKGLALGNGAIFLLLLLIPGIGILIAPPLATTAGTLEALKSLPSKPIEDYV